ncbi:family 78 glycoside hydrolase catalytic domain [Flavobacterium faecale]|uniref:family 78 glycoside hydrolase catalytic domain n=1 Tax=Flavobacterium faecale TaxID=1355330 RepID=UPI003AAB4610
MFKIRLVHLVFVLLSLQLSTFKVVAKEKDPAIKIESLSCESQTNPLAIESKQPLLSWVVKANGFNKSQSAYQIIVATRADLLNENLADVWNSKPIKSAQSTNVKYQGKELEAMQKYFWKVRVWDEKGTVSPWSTTNTFEMGLMNEANWNNAKWISLNKDTRKSDYRFREYKVGNLAPEMVTSNPAGYFREEVKVAKKVKSARAYVCGLGYYELYLNGKKVGDHVLDPAPSNYDKQAYYVSYDVSNQIKTGTNALGLIIGNGFYGQNISWKSDKESEKNISYGVPAARLLIKVTYTDGSRTAFYSNENWKESTGPIVFDNIYGGDTYDARYEINGWNQVGYNDSKWGKAKTISPLVKKISAQQIPPIRRLKELTPQKIFKSASGKWIIDFGQNIAGWVQIKVKGKEGQLIELITTEALTQKGDEVFPGSTGGGANGMKQLLQYICKGKGVETWEPKFSYHGFRYAEVSGLTTKPDKNSFKAILVATDIDEKGSFHSSDAMLNKMDAVSKWTIVDNIHGIPEDCPHREKCGWLGDAHAFCEYALYNYKMENFYKKYMEDIRTQMQSVKGHNDASKRYNVPTMIAPGKRTSSIAKLDWGVATIYLPWYNYLYYGDASIVSEYYEDMKGLTDYYLSFKNDKGIIDNGMGDWCPPLWDRKGNPSAMECDPIISANAYFYDILGIMEKFAAMQKDKTFEDKMKAEKEQLYSAFNKEFLKAIPNTNHKWYESQTATVMALQFGMVPENEIQNVVNGLEYNINVIKGGHHSTGIHGNRYIYTVLTKYGKAKLAHDILTTPTFPSQAYVINYGFTTWPERQFNWDKEKELSNSLNHPMHSGFAAYFYESLGGIKPIYSAPGFKEFTVNPQFPNDITSSSVTIPTPYGMIKNSWNVKNANFTMNLEVPFNTKANVVLTDKELQSLKINGVPFAEFQKQNTIQILNSSTLILGSGQYQMEYVK